METVRYWRFPQVVGQIGVEPLDQALPGIVPVAAQVDFPEQEIADGISPEFLDGLHRIHHIALGFGHFVPVHHQPAVAVHFLGQVEAHGHQHGRPDDGMEPDDFLPHQVEVRRPEPVELVHIPAEADAGEVGQQGIEPHVHHVFGIEGHLDAPVEAAPADAQVFQPCLMKLIISFRRDTGWMKSGWVSMYSRIRSAYLDIRKK